MPCLTAYPRSSSDDFSADASRDDVRQGLLRLDVELGGDAPELQVEVDQNDPVGPKVGGHERDVGRDHRRPDPALRTEYRHDAPWRRHDHAVSRRLLRGVAGPLEAQQQRLDPGFELPRIDGLRDDVVRAGLEELDALLDLVGLAHAQDGDAGQRRSCPGSRQ